MPITKCAASKATPAKGIDYIMDPKKVIARGNQGFISYDPQKMAKQMMQTMHLFGKGFDRDERKYYHAKVSFDPNDRPEFGGTLTPEKANLYAAKYAAEIWPNREVVWAVQDHGEAIHIHFIVAACERDTGKKLDARDAEYGKWKTQANTIAAEMGLSTIDWRKATKDKRQRETQPSAPVVSTFAEQGLRERGRSVWKDELRNIIDAAAKESRSLEQFKAALKAEGVTLTRCTDQTISYKLGEHRACRGDTLGADYTVAAIRDAIENNRADRTVTLDMKIRNKRNLTAYEQNMMRDLGRLGGFTRSEVDEICSREYTWQELANVKAKYREYRRAIFAEKAKKREREEYLWQIRNERIQAEMERRNALYDESFVGFLIFCIVDIFKEPPPSKFDEFIENVKVFVEMLSDAIAVMAGYEIYEGLDETGWAEICDREENLIEALEELDRVIFAKMEAERQTNVVPERSEPERREHR